MMSFDDIPIVSRAQALALGFRALTNTFNVMLEGRVLPREERELRGVIADMRKFDTQFALVGAGAGVQVWRGGMKLCGKLDYQRMSRAKKQQSEAMKTGETEGTKP